MIRHAGALALLVSFVALSAALAAPPAPGKHGRLAPPPHSISRDNATRLAARLARGVLLPRKSAVADSARLVALRIEFPDLAFGASPPADELHDRFYYQTQLHYQSQYFDAASHGALGLRVDVPDVVARASRPQAEYGDIAAYDSLMIALTSEAIAAADGAVDFSAYQGVLLIHAGPGQESDLAGDSPTQIWSGFLDETTFRETLSSPDSIVTGIPTNDGVLVRSVVVLPEWQVQDLQASGGTRLGSVGVYAHEIGQSLGMIPTFDASPRFPDSQGLGNFDLMAYGLWVANGHIPSLPSAFNRLLMGWVQPVEVGADFDVAAPRNITLRDQERGPADSTLARVWISAREYWLVSYILEDPDGPIISLCGSDSVGPRRFFHFEDRNANCAFDFTDTNSDSVLSPGDLIDSYAGAEWDFFMTDFQGGASAGGGYGLLVLHVDEQALQETLAGGSTNIDGDARRKAVDVEEADGIEDLDRGPDNARSFGSPDDYFVRGRWFSPATIPDTRSTNGAPTGWSLRLAALPDSAGETPGARAVVEIERTPAAAAAPRPLVQRRLPGLVGADAVALPLADGRRALVIPGDAGEVFLADAHLDEAPVSDGDSTTLRPWVTVPPALRGRWVGPPAVGDLDGDAIPDVVLTADTDSSGVRVARVFAWRRDGSLLGPLGADQLTSGPGVPTAAVSFEEFGGRPFLAFARQAGNVVTIEAMTLAITIGRSRFRFDTSGVLLGGPAPIDFSSGPVVAWLASIVADSTAGETMLHLAPLATSIQEPATVVLLPLASSLLSSPVRLASGNLDATGFEDLVVASQDGVVRIVRFEVDALGPRIDSARTDVVSLGTQYLSPLALADLDANGTLEILVASESAMHVLSATGASVAGWPYPFRLEPGLETEPEPGRGAGSPLAADLDGDGRLEIALHLPGGFFLVWDAAGHRRRDLEAALPARSTLTPLLADLDGRQGIELAALGRFEGATRYLAAPESLVTSPQTAIQVWELANAGDVAWGELGGAPGHAFRDATQRSVSPTPNDAALPSFVMHPNPASSEIRARIALTTDATVHCRLFNLEGEIVAEATRSGTAGTIVEIPLDVRGIAPGAYLAQLDLSTGGRRLRTVAVRR